MPPYASSKDTETDPDWIYTTPITEAYREHFRRLHEFDEIALKHTNGPRNVSVILIDNKYLFWKPELTYGDKDPETLCWTAASIWRTILERESRISLNRF